MNKIVFLCLLGCLLSLFSCDDKDEPIYDPVYTNFPVSFDIPCQGGQFALRQRWNNDYEMTRCEATSETRPSGEDSDAAIPVDTIRSHKVVLVGKNGKEHTCVDRYYNSWFEIKKVSAQEISLTVKPNQTGRKRYIQLGIWDFYHRGVPTRIWMEQAATE